MMARNPTPNDSGAERAKRLREQIEKLKENVPSKPDESQQTDEKLSPHEFIERRMRDLDRKK
jgi:hypothetical protein